MLHDIRHFTHPPEYERCRYYCSNSGTPTDACVHMAQKTKSPPPLLADLLLLPLSFPNHRADAAREVLNQPVQGAAAAIEELARVLRVKNPEESMLRLTEVRTAGLVGAVGYTQYAAKNRVSVPPVGNL